MYRGHIFLFDFRSSKSNRAGSPKYCACLNMFQSSSLCFLFSQISFPSPSRSIFTLHLPSQLLSVCESFQGSLSHLSLSHRHSNALTLASYNCPSLPHKPFLPPTNLSETLSTSSFPSPLQCCAQQGCTAPGRETARLLGERLGETRPLEGRCQ